MRAEAREIAALVPMPRLLESLGSCADARMRRGPCPIPSHGHSGSNPTVFSWRDDGVWHCFSRGVGGDRIALVRAVRNCSFADAVAFLAVLAGVEYQPHRISGAELERVRRHRQRAEQAAWLVHDEVLRLRGYYGDRLHRTERLQRRTGAGAGAAAADLWDRLARLAPASTFFLAAFTYTNRLDSAGLVRFSLMSPGARRAAILGD